MVVQWRSRKQTSVTFCPAESNKIFCLYLSASRARNHSCDVQRRWLDDVDDAVVRWFISTLWESSDAALIVTSSAVAASATVADMTSSHCLANQSSTQSSPCWPIDRRADWCKRGEARRERRVGEPVDMFVWQKRHWPPLTGRLGPQNANSAPPRLRNPVHSFCRANWKRRTTAAAF